MRIGIIQPRVSYFQGGGEKTALKFALELAKVNGISVNLYTTKAISQESSMFTDFKRRASRNISILEIPVPDKFKYLYNIKAGQDQSRWDTESLFFNSLVYKQLEIDKPDIIWCNYIVDCLVKPPRIPSILYLVGYPREYLNLRKSWIAQYNEVICISDNIKIKWNMLTDNSLPNSPVIYTAPVLDDAPNSEKIVFPEPGFNILFAGRLIERKGVQTLISAINDIRNEIINIHLNVLGTGPYDDELKKIAQDVDLTVNFLGHKNNMASYYAAADICVFPSHKGEGLMGVVLEAMLCGACVITTTDNGNEELIVNGKDGILVKSGDVKELADSILFAYNNPDRIRRIGKAAKDKISKKFTWPKHVVQFLKIVQKIIN